MTDARSLVDDTRSQLADVEAQLAGHAYLAELERGAIAKEELCIVAGEQYYIISSDLRSIALLLSWHGHLPTRDYLLGSLNGEAAAREALLAFAAEVEMDEDALRAYEPQPGCQAYPSYVAWLASHGSDAEFAAAFLVNLPAWGANCGRMSSALRSRYGISDGGTQFFDAFAAPAPEFERDSLDVIQGGLDRGVPEASIARAARLIQAYELQYWDTLLEASRA